MTLCIYKDGKMYSDVRCTTGDNFIDNANKIFIVYKTPTGILTLDKTEEEYAIISYSGYLENIYRFLSWFINSNHDVLNENVLNIPLGEDSNSYLVYFKKGTVRKYIDFKAGCYLEYNVSETVCIGSGAVSAETLFTYDKDIDVSDVYETVSKYNYTVSSDFKTTTFSGNL